VYNLKTKDSGHFKKQWLLEIDEVNKQLAKARSLLVSGDIEPGDYRLVKTECEEKINGFERELSKVAVKENDSLTLFKNLVNSLENVDLCYSEAKIELQRDIIGTIYPQKLEIEKGTY
jgi:hypothetical protein